MSKKEIVEKYWYSAIEGFVKRHQWIIGIALYLLFGATNKYFENEDRMNKMENKIAIMQIQLANGLEQIYRH